MGEESEVKGARWRPWAGTVVPLGVSGVEAWHGHPGIALAAALLPGLPYVLLVCVAGCVAMFTRNPARCRAAQKVLDRMLGRGGGE